MNANVNDRVLHVSFGQIKRTYLLTIRILLYSQIALYMLWILITMPKCTETKWEVGTEAWSRRYCINLLRQWGTKSGANTCAVWSREESVAGSCVAGLIPGGRVPEERSRRGGAAVCRSVTALPARRALAAVSSCAAPRRAAIVPSSRHLLCLSATLVRMARLVWTCDVIFLFFQTSASIFQWIVTVYV